MAKLRLADRLALPLDGVTRTFGIFGQRGTGKSTTGAVLVEQAVRAGGRAVVLDPTGVWYGLTRAGEAPGLPGVVLGGEYADAPLEPHAGRLVAEFVISTDYPLVVLDMKLLRKGQRQRFAMELLEMLYHDNRDPLLVVFDEAAQFAPQQMREGGDVPRLLGAVEDLVKLGRSRGLGAVMIEQRIATLNANVREQIETLIAHRLVGPLDRKALKQWIDAQGEPEREAQALALIPKLGPGEALVWSPAFLQVFGQFSIHNATTFDSRATPEVGRKRKALTQRAPVDLDTLREKMAETIEQAEANDPKKLRAELAEMRRKYAELTNLVERREQEEPHTVEVPVEVPVVTDEQIERLEKLGQRVEMDSLDLRTTYEEFHKVLFPLAMNVKNALQARDFPRTRPAVPPRLGDTSRRQPDRATVTSRTSRERPVPEASPEQAASGGARKHSEEELVDAIAGVVNSEQKVLDALAWYEALGITQPTKSQVGYVAGYKARGGRFTNLLGALRAKGLIEYPQPGVLTLTHAGRLAARDPGLPRTNEALQQAVLSRLQPSQAKLLEALLRVHPHALDRAALGEQTGYEPRGGRFTNLLGELRTLGLIEYPQPGIARACDVLFPVA